MYVQKTMPLSASLASLLLSMTQKRIKTDDKTKLSNRRRRFAVTIIDSALIFYKVAALQCTAFD